MVVYDASSTSMTCDEVFDQVTWDWQPTNAEDKVERATANPFADGGPPTACPSDMDEDQPMDGAEAMVRPSDGPRDESVEWDEVTETQPSIRHLHGGVRRRLDEEDLWDLSSVTSHQP